MDWRRSSASLGWLLIASWLPGCGPGQRAGDRQTIDPTNVFHRIKLDEIDAAIVKAIGEHRCPGGVLWLERGGAGYCRAYGQRALTPQPEPMTPDTIFDAASLTKVIATTPAVMLLVERGKIDLDAAVVAYLPEFKGNGREKVTVRQLLAHTSGLRPDISLKPDWNGYETAIRLCCAEEPRAAPDERFIYSDTNFILLAEIVRRVSGIDFARFVAGELYQPLRMTDTGFNPPPDRIRRIAPTEVENGRPVRGQVHDPRARRMGGVAGHAGLFTTAADLARFARMMLAEGRANGGAIFRPETVREMTRVQTPEQVDARRGLGWDIDSPYASQRGTIFPLGGYGHTGWTGTSLWIDPFSQTFLVFLSNRNHPDESGSVVGLRRTIGTLAAEAVKGFNFHFVPGALPGRKTDPAAVRRELKTVRVANGIDVLAQQGFAPLRGLKVGLITNHTGHDRERRSTIDLLHAAPDVHLRALFSPEHGIRGMLDARVADDTDPRTGLPIFSLYGETRSPTPEQLEGLDALVFDIQDIGCRFYTYISTMGLAMEAAAAAGLSFFVLDRVNPIGGVTVEGPVHTGASSFTAFHRLPVRHGMTVGELARMFNAERGWNCRLTVIPVEGWTRDLWFDETGLPWTNPSPNMRSLTQATLYPGIGLLETTPLSVGRGTDTPFELIGAPYIDDVELAWELNQANPVGLRFVPERFTPSASVYGGELCRGVRIIVVDRASVRPVEAGILIARTLHRLYPKGFDLGRFDRLLQHGPTITAIREGLSPDETGRGWRTELAEFHRRRTAFLLYP